MQIKLTLPPFPTLSPSPIIQVVFVPGDKARAAPEGPVPQWWTAGGAVEPKLSPSPNVCTFTPHMLSHGEVKLKSESESRQSVTLISHIWYDLILKSYQMFLYVCVMFLVRYSAMKKTLQSLTNVVYLCKCANMHAPYVCLCFKHISVCVCVYIFLR